MTRKDKKSHQYISCGKTLASPQKLRQHYQSKKNQCNSNPEAGPSPTTQAYREEYTTIQQVIDQEKKYAPKKHFRSIYEVEDGIVEEEPPSRNIEFLEKRPDFERQHPNLTSMIV